MKRAALLVLLTYHRCVVYDFATGITHTTAGGYIAPIHLKGMGVMPMNDMNVFLLLIIVLVLLTQKK